MEFFKQHKSKIILLIFIIFTAFIIIDSSNEPKIDPIKEEKPVEIKKKKEIKEDTQKVLVDVKGEINSPGVYELTSKNTVIDAVNKAGGLTNKSDTSNINLSKKLEDEMVIIVYSKEEIRKMKTKEAMCPSYNNACIDKKDEKSNLENKTKSQSEPSNKKININSANITELQTLEGIGQAKAKAIIEYRESNGNFQKIEDIKNVSGIGDSAFEKIKDKITI